MLAYASALSLLDAATMPHAISYFDESMQIASLDHAMWFHRPFPGLELAGLRAWKRLR